MTDDGAGLNRERILAKAASQGLTVSENMSDDEVAMLIFAPGFSTAEQVTDVSGRGVGMDVVKRNIQEMGGHVEIQSMQGTGTTIRILLPLTLAILDGMSVRVADEVFILPLNAVMESLQPREADLHPLAGGERVLEVRVNICLSSNCGKCSTSRARNRSHPGNCGDLTKWRSPLRLASGSINWSTPGCG